MKIEFSALVVKFSIDIITSKFNELLFFLLNLYPYRNSVLESKGFTEPKAVKTGTTIVGIVYKDGVILGADTRATEGPIVSDKNCAKIHFLTKNMYCCGAGTAADTEKTTKKISSTLLLHGLNTGRTVPVIAANTLLKQMLFRYQVSIILVTHKRITQ